MHNRQSQSLRESGKRLLRAALPNDLYQKVALTRWYLQAALSPTPEERLVGKWQVSTFTGRPFEFNIAPEVKINIYSDDFLSHLICFRNFEANERDFVYRFLKEGDAFVDVGANVGLFSLIAARAVGPDGHVIAFEPSPKICQRLMENVLLNDFTNVQIIQSALSSKTGESVMSIAQDGKDVFNSLAKPIAGEQYASEAVSTVKWDDFVSDCPYTRNVTLMKIDVEGWEHHVLLGGSEWLSRDNAPVLQVEFTDAAARAAGVSCQENYRLLERLGFKLFTYDSTNKQLIHDPIRDEYPYLNLFAIKDLAAAQERLTR